MGLPQRVEKIVHGEEIHWFSGKEKVTGAVSKESHTDSILEQEITLHYRFP